MINFSLPNFYFNFNVNNFIIKLNQTNSEYFKEKINFQYAYGNFPYAYWNGGYNNNMANDAFYHDFIRCPEESLVPISFNCSNIYLYENDYENTMMNLILKENENGINCIELSNIELYNFLIKKYPHYNYIFSKEADLLNPLTPEIINVLSETFYMIQVPNNKYNDFNFLNEIKNKEKIEITINDKCSHFCQKYNLCKLHEHQAQYNFSGKNNYKNCKERKKYEDNFLISLEDIKNIYLPLGFSHFSFDDVISDKQKDALLFAYVKYFIKEEYQILVLRKAMEQNIL